MPSLLPDPDHLDAVAARIDAQAGRVRTRAHLLAGGVAATPWHGAAARSFAGTATDVVGGLRSSATRLEGAAVALRTHAANVRTRIADLRALSTHLGHLGLDGLDLLGDSSLHPGRLPGDLVSIGTDVGNVAGDAVSGAGHALGSTLHAVGL